MMKILPFDDRGVLEIEREVRNFSQIPLRFLKSAHSNPNFTRISINSIRIPVVSTVSRVISCGEWITPNTLSRTTSNTAPIKPQPIISSAEVILSAVTTDLSSFVTINNSCKDEDINNFGLPGIACSLHKKQLMVDGSMAKGVRRAGA